MFCFYTHEDLKLPKLVSGILVCLRQFGIDKFTRNRNGLNKLKVKLFPCMYTKR